MKSFPLTGRRRALISCALLTAVGPLHAGEAGKLTREIWTGMSGGTVADFTSSPRYWQQADQVSTFPGAAAPSNIGDSYASRVRGYIIAPVSGDYTFWIASDDSSELWLSTDASKFGREKIAFVSGWVGAQAWDAKPSQKSAPVHLEAGQKYFIEALHKEASGGDHLAIAWQTPGGVRQLIPATALESSTVDPDDVDNDDLSDAWETTHGFDLADNGTLHPDQHPLADPDQDGYTNYEESRYGTDPYERAGLKGSLPSTPGSASRVPSLLLTSSARKPPKLPTGPNSSARPKPRPIAPTLTQPVCAATSCRPSPAATPSTSPATTKSSSGSPPAKASSRNRKSPSTARGRTRANGPSPPLRNPSRFPSNRGRNTTLKPGSKKAAAATTSPSAGKSPAPPPSRSSPAPPWPATCVTRPTPTATTCPTLGKPCTAWIPR
jgi:hypothetical protein